MRDNVLLVRFDASGQELQTALDNVQVSEFLPPPSQGVDTPVGDQAAHLSVRQTQRMAVTCTLLDSCSLLLLDKLAVSLDAHGEQCIVKALNVTSLHQTTLTVTHQSEDLAGQDIIQVMQNSQTAEQGRYAELSMASGPLTTLLAHRQEEI